MNTIRLELNDAEMTELRIALSQAKATARTSVEREEYLLTICREPDTLAEVTARHGRAKHNLELVEALIAKIKSGQAP